MHEISRREALWQVAVGAAVVAGGTVTANDERAVPIVDCHTHFYDPTRPQGVPWPGKNDAALYKPVLPEHFRQLVKPWNVTGTVVVEASPWIEDNQWLLDIAAKDRVILGIVGNLDPAGEEFARHLQRFAQNELFRGLRIGHDSLRKGLENPEYVANLKRLADAGLELDVNGGPDMPATVARLAERFPDLRIVINHVANLRIDGEQLPMTWLLGMKAAAQHARVYCKVSALVEGAVRPAGQRAPERLEFYRPVLDAVWKIFGEDRLIYGSNWPVSERAADYGTLLRIVREYFAEKGRTASEKFFATNSRTAYGWKSR